MPDAQEKTPTLLVSALVAVDKGVVLLTKHAPYFKLHLPDGEVRYGERLWEALERAFREDFGVAPLIIGTGPWLVTETVRKNGAHHVTHHFRAAVPRATPLRPREGIEAVRFDLIDGFAPGDFLSSTVTALNAAVRHRLL